MIRAAASAVCAHLAMTACSTVCQAQCISGTAPGRCRPMTPSPAAQQLYHGLERVTSSWKWRTAVLCNADSTLCRASCCSCHEPPADLARLFTSLKVRATERCCVGEHTCVAGAFSAHAMYSSMSGTSHARRGHISRPGQGSLRTCLEASRTRTRDCTCHRQGDSNLPHQVLNHCSSLCLG